MTPSNDNDPQRLQSNSTSLEGPAIELKFVADSIAGLLPQRFLNETNLPGKFNFSMKFADMRPRATPDENAPDAAPPSSPPSPSVSAGAWSRAGAPAPVFVVEKLQRPSEN